MSPQHTLIIDTDHLADVPEDKRFWLERWLTGSHVKRCKNIATVGCASRLETVRVTIMLTRRGLPPGAIINRGAA